MKKKELEDGCLWLIVTLLAAIAAVLGGLFLTIFGLKAVIYGDINATILWTGFGLYWGGKVLLSIMSCIEKAIQKAGSTNE